MKFFLANIGRNILYDIVRYRVCLSRFWLLLNNLTEGWEFSQGVPMKARMLRQIKMLQTNLSFMPPHKSIWFLAKEKRKEEKSSPPPTDPNSSRFHPPRQTNSLSDGVIARETSQVSFSGCRPLKDVYNLDDTCLVAKSNVATTPFSTLPPPLCRPEERGKTAETYLRIHST